MALNPPPIIDASLGLITQSLLRTDMSRASLITFAVSVTAGVGVANAQDAVDDFQANFNANIAPAMDSNVNIQPPFIKLGDGTNVPAEAVAAGAAIVGGNAGTYAPPNIAALVKKTTGFGGKKSRGRTYIPFILPVTAVSENGTVDPGTATALNVRLATFLGQLITDGTVMVIANKIFTVPVPPLKPFVSEIQVGHNVLSYLCEPMIATQRRRLGR